jgi:hypothetical protein
MEQGSAKVLWGAARYPISRALIEDGRQNLILAAGPGSLPVRCPVRLMHSLADEEVPYTLALQLVETVASTDASVVLLKGSSHAMDRETDLLTMKSMIAEVITDPHDRAFDLRSPASG